MSTPALKFWFERKQTEAGLLKEILGLGKKIHKIILEHFTVSEYKEVFNKQNEWGMSKGS